MDCSLDDVRRKLAEVEATALNTQIQEMEELIRHVEVAQKRCYHQNWQWTGMYGATKTCSTCRKVLN